RRAQRPWGHKEVLRSPVRSQNESFWKTILPANESCARAQQFRLQRFSCEAKQQTPKRSVRFRSRALVFQQNFGVLDVPMCEMLTNSKGLQTLADARRMY